MSVKEVTKALKNALYEDTSAGEDSPSPGFPTEPSEDLSNALQTFVASAEDTGLSKEDASKLHDALLEFASHVGSAPAKRCLGLQSLAQLLNVDNAKWLPRPPLQLLQSLWSSLLRPCLAPALEKTAKRDPLRKSEAEAVKRITLWALEPNEEEAVQDATLEAVVLNDYCQLAQSAAYSALSADKSLLHLKDVLVASARSRPKASSTRFFFVAKHLESFSLHSPCHRCSRLSSASSQSCCLTSPKHGPPCWTSQATICDSIRIWPITLLAVEC